MLLPSVEEGVELALVTQPATIVGKLVILPGNVPKKEKEKVSQQKKVSALCVRSQGTSLEIVLMLHLALEVARGGEVKEQRQRQMI
jgi:ribosomal protein L30E